MTRFVNDDEFRIEERADAEGTRITVYAGEKSKVFRSWQMKDFRKEARKYCEELEAAGYHRRLGQMEKDLAAMTKEEKVATAEQMARQR
jgi:hypothetical protein